VTNLTIIVRICSQQIQIFLKALMKNSAQANSECCGWTQRSNRFTGQENPSTLWSGLHRSGGRMQVVLQTEARCWGEERIIG